MAGKPKTALVLGGGGSRGAYEIGVWQALREMDHPIDIITGTSVGAINGAMIAQDSYELTVELWRKIENNMIFDGGILKKGDPPLFALLKNYLDEAAVRKSPIDYGLVTVELPSMAPHRLFREDIPEGKLIDFILASSSVFPALLPRDIDNIKYVDGGYQDNLPVDMAIQRGAEKIIAVDLDMGIIKHAPVDRAIDFRRIRSKWDLGHILVFKGSNATRIMRLGYLDTLKAFGFYDGQYYCFPKGQFSKKALEDAELAGKLFGLDPGTLYTKEIFHRKLRETVWNYRREIRRELEEFNIGIRNKTTGKKGIPNLLQKINERTLSIVIADFLRGRPLDEKTFLTKSALMLFQEPFSAAVYLLRESLIAEE